MAQMIVWSLTQSQTSWSVRSSGPQKKTTTNKAGGGDGIPAELFQILKDDTVIWKTQQWPQDWKRSVFILIPNKGNAKESSNYRTIVLILHAGKLMLKSLQARFQQYMNQRSNCQHLLDHRKSKRIPEKNIYFSFIDYAKAFDSVDHNKLENSQRDGNTRPL